MPELSSPTVTPESLRRWVGVLLRERASLEAERISLAEARRTLVRRETLLATHHRLSVVTEAALREKHRALALREHAVGLREKALETSRRLEAVVTVPPAGTQPHAPEPSVAGPAASGSPAVRPQAGPTPVPADAEDSVRPGVPEGRGARDRLPSGTPRLDDLLLGGLPPRGHVALVGDAFVGKEVLLYSFLAEGLRRQEPAIVVTATRTPQEVARALRAVLSEFDEHERQGRVVWVDATGSGADDRPNHFAPRGSDDMAGLSQALVLASRRCIAASPTGRFRVGFLGLSAVLAHHRERESLLALQTIVGILRSHGALAMYSLEAGAVTEPQVESLLGRIDGAIVLRQGRGRTLLAAQGFGGVATADWVECRVTEKGLVLGSFALERIR